MSKIIQAINAMISNPSLISSVQGSDLLIFFLYKEKYKWSIFKSGNGVHTLQFFPGDISIQELVSADEYQWDFIEKVSYNDNEIGTKEAKASFAELYTTVSERRYGLNDVLEDIISDTPF